MSKPKLPKVLSAGEETFALHCRAEKLSPEREFRFHPERKWRFDFAWPDVKLAVEVEGVSAKFGRHQRPGGFAEDCRKYNSAVLLGWRVLRYPPDLVMRGDAIADVLGVLR